MLKILKSFIVIAAVASLATGATGAYFSDTEMSNDNSFTSGSLDLNVDGGNVNVVKFNVANLKPGSQPTGSWLLANVGSINGFLDIENITVTNLENVITEPESEAGDLTDPLGELGDVLNIRLFVDKNGDGWISTGETVFYNGKVSNLPSSFDLNEPINAGANVKVRAILDWSSSSSDNLAQTDSLDLDMSFELAQTTGQ